MKNLDKQKWEEQDYWLQYNAVASIFSIFGEGSFDKLCPKTLSILYNQRSLYKNKVDQPENLENLYFFPLSIFTKTQIGGNKVPELKIDVWNMKINWNAINWCCEIGIWQLWEYQHTVCVCPQNTFRSEFPWNEKDGYLKYLHRIFYHSSTAI